VGRRWGVPTPPLSTPVTTHPGVGAAGRTGPAGVGQPRRFSQTTGLVPPPAPGPAPWRGRLAVVGLGLEGAPSASPRGRRLLEAADRLIGTARHLALVDRLPGERRPWDGRPETLADLLAGRDVRGTVLLASGDPNLFGVGASLVERWGPEAVDVEPAVSSLALALARAGVPAAGAALLSAHGRSLAAAAGQARAARRAAILTDPHHDPGRVAAALARAGVESDARLVVAERLGSPGERLREGTVAGPPAGPFDPLSVVVLDRRGAAGPGLGAPESEYEHEAGMVTKAEVRVLALAALDLAAEDVVWDLGAGSGSVSVEAGRQAARGAVYAVEVRPERARRIRRNLARHGSWNVEVIEEDALRAIPLLPVPDAVFVGGGGPRLAAIAAASLERLRARSSPAPGRLVASVATVDSLVELAAELRTRGLDWRASQVQVSRARDLAGRLAWEALNPVCLVSARVPAP
jgi:precorrin-6Y C5,15-methyltransferase (decarboxylating)